MKFLIDADFRSLKQVFEKHDYDALDVRDINLREDEEIVKYAKRNRCVIVTRDLGFGNIIEYPIKEYFGIIIFRLPFYFTSKMIGKILDEFLASIDVKHIIRTITIVELERYRIRK